ncbi:hypothetical protein [Hydrogenivirga sp. 128-5-R1-1]|uniref:hypothetical protein n=1 Tax=Hydrogenivirga sp. 128-5-R1-1 TaxID=392423 RepID=UPI00015F18A7|nr:hypothetical protein [Hydrogenivirga sp. 128-5-R1-1]EDP75391.1 hypothetical protein HG1285_15541 [Hydrogenivirga sp. 128-5-R1-1]
MVQEQEVVKASLEDILRLDAGSIYAYDSSAGERYERWEVTIYTKNGDRIDLPIYHERYEFGSNHEPDREEGEPKTIGEALPELHIEPNEIKEVVVYERYYCSWEDYADWEKTIIYIPEDTIDIETLRREMIRKIKEMADEEVFKLYYSLF